MSHAKETIVLLTRVFQSLGFHKCKAEWFRLAKFNSNDIVSSFWQLLYELTVFLEQDGIPGSKQMETLGNDKVVTYVKHSLQERGYYCAEFSNLPSDMSQGSRELLLAVGWVLSSQKIIDRYLDRMISPLENTELTMHKVDGLGLSSVSSTLSTTQKLHHMQLVNGKLYMTLKQLYSLQRAKSRLQHKVHSSTEGVSVIPGRQHLSVLETHLLRHPVQLKTMLQMLEEENSVLNTLVQWKDHEHIFWKWMESVLILKLEEADESMESVPLTHYNIDPSVLHKLAKARQTLETSILSNEPIIAQLEELWESKHADVTKLELMDLEKAVHMELDYFTKIMGKKKTSKVPSSLSEPIFLYSKPLQKKGGNSVYIPELHSGELEQGREAIDIQLEIVSLQSQIARLELETSRKARSYQQQLDNLSATIPNAVCIKPSSVL